MDIYISIITNINDSINNIHNYIMGSHNSETIESLTIFTCYANMDIRNWITDIHNWIMHILINVV